LACQLGAGGQLDLGLCDSEAFAIPEHFHIPAPLHHVCRGILTAGISVVYYMGFSSMSTSYF